MKAWIQRVTVGIVLRVVHAALVELRGMDTRVQQEFERMPEGLGYAVHTGWRAPELHVQWVGGCLHRLAGPPQGACTLHIKSLPLSFRLFTGQMGLAQAYARHAFTMQGEVADVMRLARLVNLVEAYLFPRFITRRILTDIPPLQASPLRVYGRIFLGFLTGRYARG